jgi:putative ABC transport system substrate-binding protein
MSQRTSRAGGFRRREIIGGLSIFTFPRHLVMAAQSPNPVVGLLNGGSPDLFQDRLTSINRGMAEAGFIDGRNFTLVSLWADGRYDRLPGLAAELVAKGVAVIVATGGGAAAAAAKRATTKVPIVFVLGTDPVQAGLVNSLSRPGGNATGVSVLSGTLAPKRLELLREMLPRVDLIALLINPAGAVAAIDQKYTQDAANVFGQRLLILEAGSYQDLEVAFEAIRREKADALVVGSDGWFTDNRVRLTSLAARDKVPTIYHDRAFTRAGGLVSYGASLGDGYRLAGNYVGQILNGANPAELPVQYPTVFEFVINLKAAAVLGLTVPRLMLARADEVIE